jgi:hypothetical protein
MNAPRSAFGASPHWGAQPAAGQSPIRGCRWVSGSGSKPPLALTIQAEARP